MEAMRLIAGLPLYEAGHATHMYGPLLTVFLAGIFRLTGLNLLAGRVVFSIFSFILAAVLSLIFCRGQSRKYWLFAFLLFLGVNLRTNLIFFSAQPDCVAALVAVAALSYLDSAPRIVVGRCVFDQLVPLRDTLEANQRSVRAYPGRLRFDLETEVC